MKQIILTEKKTASAEVYNHELGRFSPYANITAATVQRIKKLFPAVVVTRTDDDGWIKEHNGYYTPKVHLDIERHPAKHITYTTLTIQA